MLGAVHAVCGRTADRTLIDNANKHRKTQSFKFETHMDPGFAVTVTVLVDLFSSAMLFTLLCVQTILFYLQNVVSCSLLLRRITCGYFVAVIVSTILC